MKTILNILLALLSFHLKAQKIDSIYFHLYTDSLKKGQHNYINVDGKTTEGKWLPLTAKEVNLSCKDAIFQGNELILPNDFKKEKVTVIAVLKSNQSVQIERTIWIKTIPDGDLPTIEEVMKKDSKKEKEQKPKKNQ